MRRDEVHKELNRMHEVLRKMAIDLAMGLDSAHHCRKCATWMRYDKSHRIWEAAYPIPELPCPDHPSPWVTLDLWRIANQYREDLLDENSRLHVTN